MGIHDLIYVSEVAVFDEKICIMINNLRRYRMLGKQLPRKCYKCE